MDTPRERCKVGESKHKLCRHLMAAGEEDQKLSLKQGGSTCITDIQDLAFDQVSVSTRCQRLLGSQQLSHCSRTESLLATSHKPGMIPVEAAQAD